MQTDETDAKQVLEAIRKAEYEDSVTAALLAAVYGVEHDKQFEEERGPVQARLRDLIIEAMQEAS